ncbi:MAG TPA: efflux transporter outer membrane subunit [Burkholderiales bacterium]|nr:efflux transporter outer membrane subunit [Burkholderiales bacterium]
MTMQKLALLLSVLLLAACSSGPDFSAPDAPKTQAYVSKTDVLPSQQRIALGKRIETDWWALFSSPELNALIRQTVENNYDLAAAHETLAQAEESVKAQSGSLMPQAALGATAGRQKYGAALFGPANFSIPPFTYYEVGPSLSWTPDLFGGGRREVERQQALAEYQAEQMDALYVALTGDTVTTALDIAATGAEISMLRNIIAEDENTLRLIESSYAAGSSTRMDIQSARNRKIEDQALLPPLIQRLSVSRHALAIFVGRAPADWLPPELDFNRFTLPQELPLSLPSELVKKRPDILAAAAELHAASAAIGVATANLYPQITLSANMMQEALTPVGLFSAANNAWALAGGVSAPLFNGGTLTAEKRRSEHAYRAALARYQQIILVAFRQVADALTALAQDEEAQRLADNAADSARVSLELARASYHAGAIGLIDLQNAERALTKTQWERIRVRQQRYLDSARLFVALGGSPMAVKKS